MSTVLTREKTNINKPLAVTSADVGKVVGVDEDGNIALIDGGGSGGSGIVIYDTEYDSETLVTSIVDLPQLSVSDIDDKIIFIKVELDEITEYNQIIGYRADNNDVCLHLIDSNNNNYRWNSTQSQYDTSSDED